ncbi:MAG TPA: FAD-binding and (Fe-S)-binding domain-containing protein [Kofleriaceae bacterium]|nr:FAD-binding and (Fe-S)-binding domain-containing protein [Kofleriaceae bacterium]
MIRSKQLAVVDDDLERALADRLDGEVRFDTGSRAMYAHDASNYRQVPIGVVVPRHVEDVVETVRICRERDVPVLGRGGGTSLAGQCVNHAIVIDFSKYMNRVLEIDRENRRVRVEPGLVLDDLRRALSKHGLTFGPDPSTHSHCTLGGMLGNNSCGVHSVMAEFYGPGARTSDHVESLDVLTYAGDRLRVGATSDDELRRILAAGGAGARIYEGMRQLRDRYADRIRQRFAPIPRRVSGYSIDELLPEHGFHVARALVGTESTCVTILEATLHVYRARPQRALVVLGYPSIYEAGDHVPQIRSFRPVGLEAVDERLIDDMKRTGLHRDDVGLLPGGKGWLLVEFGSDSLDEAIADARRMMDALKKESNAPAMKLFEDPAQTQRIWLVRESGLGATAYIPGRPDTYEGWEDSSVPPDQLGAYLRDFRALLDRYHFDTALYGHFGQGCVHCRINFDLSDAAGIDVYRRFTSEAADLVVRHRGSLSGEHGDGQSRGELLVRQFGPELVSAFREFKALWDPRDRMNPGKVIDGMLRTENLKLASYHPRPQHTAFHPRQDDGDFRHAALRCVGIGNCRRSGGGTMCPSYMVTHEEKHSTRGRARLLYEMLQGDVVTDGWASEEVKDALDLCLACKGCKGDCPVHVDMATYKSEFLAHYYEHHMRPRYAYAMGWIHRWARLGSHVPWLANAMTQTSGMRRMFAWLGGIAQQRPAPRFAREPFTRTFKSTPSSRPPVVLWPDTFNNHFFPRTLAAAVEVLEHAGYRVIVPRAHVCCGRALYDYGMLDAATRLWRRTFDVFEPVIARGIPIVGLEPSCVAAFRDELPNLFPRDDRARRLSDQTKTLAELLRDEKYEAPPLHGRVLLHGHCHHKAVLDFDAERELLAAMHVDLEVPDSGCCGLAGSFGYESGHYDISMAIGERVLLPAVRNAAADTLLVADGFSCREQIQQGTGRQAQHVAEVLALAIRRLHDTSRVEPGLPADLHGRHVEHRAILERPA